MEVMYQNVTTGFIGYTTNENSL